MTYPQAEDLFDYWRVSPPEHELQAIWLRAATTWEPETRQPVSEVDAQELHRESLERRWASGHYMNPKQMWEAMGGTRSLPKGSLMTPAERARNPHIITPDRFPGFGPFPGAH